jgi:hypothetical protein
MDMTFRNLVVSVFLLLSSSCGPADKKLVTNERGGYSVEVQPGWDYSIESSGMKALKSESLVVQATFGVTVFTSEYETLQESFNEYVAQLPSGFANYVKVSSGETEINGVPAMWHRMKDTDNGIRFETVVYVTQPVGKKIVMISCSAAESSFREYEEDFTSMAFSLKTSKKKN